MANLTVSSCTPVYVIEQMTGPTGEVIPAGRYARLNTTTGVWEFGNGTTATEVGTTRGITIQAASPAGEAVTVVRKGILDLGEALVGLAFDAPVYIGDTDGTLSDTAGTVSTVVGRVVPGWANTTADKLLYVDL